MPITCTGFPVALATVQQAGPVCEVEAEEGETVRVFRVEAEQGGRSRE